MTPARHRRDAVAGTCPFGMGRISTPVCGSCMDIAMERTWL